VAPPTGTLRVGRYFLALLVLFAILASIVAFGSRHTPKLGLDLVGGTQVIFTAKTQNGSTPSSSSMQQAKQIMENRVNGTGVTEATVVIQGNNQIVVSIPGNSATDIAKLGAAAVLNFRGLVAPTVTVNCAAPGSASGGPAGSAPSGSGSASPSPSPSPTSSAASGAAAAERPLARPAARPAVKAAGSKTPVNKAATGSGTAGATASGSPAPSGSASPSGTTPPAASPSASAAPACSATSVRDAAAAAKFTVPLSEQAYNSLGATNQQVLSQALSRFDCASGQTERDDPKSYFVACDSSGQVYLLGPVIVAGKQIASASALAPNTQQGTFDWTVQLNLKGSGQKSWADYTTAHNANGNKNITDTTATCSTGSTPCADFVGFTLDGIVISAPYNINAINGQATQIQGQFTQTTATDLANKLKYGALPLSFRADDQQTVSATLGTAQLKAGLLAGGIGLVLVVIYSLIYYRALGLVTIASLLVSGGLTYGCLVLLGTQIGFTLSLAGIAGFIVAVGITADSFVVFFERLKDEVHEGRSVRVAVPRAWVRARRTILSADTVSFLAAAILYYFAAGDVKGFAFTLGLSTILDLIVVFLFTHPMVSLLSRSRAFGSARFTGLDALRGTPLPDPVDSPARGARRTPSRPAARRSSAPVAVLDEPEAPPAEDDVAAPATDAAGEPPQPDSPDEPRRRTTPEPGSAAERAAARRARMRQRRDDKGES
jgi:preprotein translocase subunit SecD